jgi:toxin CcdB
MARFDVYFNPSASERRVTPYFLDVQNDHLEGLQTRVVVPLRRASAFPRKLRELNPEVTLDGVALVLDTSAIGAVPVTDLRKLAGRLKHEQAAILDALDTLFGSY